MNYINALITLIIADFIFISLIKEKFGNMISEIQNSVMKPDIKKVLLSYFILYLSAIILIPKTKSYLDTFLLGFFIYAIYETTNYALFDKWNPTIVIVDSVWGGFLFLLIRYFSLKEK